MNEEIRLLLKTNQLILRDRFWNHADLKEQAKITDENITNILNPTKETELSEKTSKHFALSEGEVKE